MRLYGLVLLVFLNACAASSRDGRAIRTDERNGENSESATRSDDPEKEFSINMDYPNPYSAGSAVVFTLPDTDHVSIVFFNVLGQPVRTLADSVLLVPGNHRLVWDGLTDSGSAVPSGVYFYRISTSDTTATRKMTWLR